MDFPIFPLKKIMIISGVKVAGSKYWFLSKIYNYTILFFAFMAVPGSIAQSLRQDIPLADRFPAFQLVAPAFHINSKQINFLFNHKLVDKLLESMDDFQNEIKDHPTYLNLLIKSNRESIFVAKTLYVMPILFMLLASLGSLYQHFAKGSVTIPLEIYLILDTKQYFYLTFVLDLLVFIPMLLITVNSMLFSYHTTNHVALRMKIIRLSLHNEIKENFAVYKMHQKALNFVADLNNMIGLQNLIEILCSYFQGCFIGYCLLKYIKDNDPRVTSQIILVACCIQVPLVLCVACQRVTQASEELLEGIYQSPWIARNPKERKNLLFMFMRATDVSKIHYRYLMTFGMERFATMMQGTYTFLMMMKKVMDQN